MKSRFGSLIIPAFVAAAFAAGLAGCGGAKQAQSEIRYVWPELPDSPRVAYVQTFRGEKDFGGGLSGLVGDIAGSDKTDIMLGRPFDICIADNGRFYITDAAIGVMMYDTKERKAEMIGEKSPIALDDPRGIAYHNGQLFIGLAKAKKVVVLDDEGNLLRVIGREGRFPNPVDIVLDTLRNRVYIVDIKLDQIACFNEAGDSLFTVGKIGLDAGRLNFPQAAAVDKNGFLYVADGFNYRVQVFDSTGAYVRQFGRQGDVFGTFSRMKGIALDSYGNIYVLDAMHQNFQIFNNAGEMLMFVGKYSVKNDGFINPVSIAIDKQNRIYVTDGLNSRVQVFQLLKGD
jgi:DNA-binding beta-propeller fold protein YncE